MIEMVSGIASSLASATTITKTLLGMKIDQEVISKVSELQNAIMTAQAAALSGLAERAELIQRIEQLEFELKARGDWEKESSRYRLEETPAGPHIYVLMPDESRGEPPHRLCPNCFQKKQKSILQTTVKSNGYEKVSCPSCKIELTLSVSNEAFQSRSSNDSRWELDF